MIPESSSPSGFVSRKTKHPEDLVDMTAMVDIVFFLLIFFLVTSMQDVESVIDFPTPQQSSAESTAPVTDLANDPSIITVTLEDDDSVWLADEQVFGEQDLRAKLRAARRQDERITGMMVIAAPDSSHGTLIMVLDAAADAGLQDLKFSVPEASDVALTAG